MEIVIGALAVLLIIQTIVFVKYQRQVKDICRQL